MSRSAVHLVGVASGSQSTWDAAIAQNAGAHARILMPESIGAGRHGRSLLRSIAVVSFLQHDWEFWFWANQNGQQSGHPDLENFLGFWSFSVAGGDGKQIGATGLYYYYIDGLAIPIHDEDAHSAPTLGTFLNVTLVDRTAGGKTAGSWFQARFGLEPTYGD